MVRQVRIGAIALLLVMVIGSARADGPRRYDGYSVVQATVQSETQLERVTEIVESVWSDYVGVGTLDVLVSPGQLAELDD